MKVQIMKLNGKALCEVSTADLWSAYMNARRVRIHAQHEHAEAALQYEIALLEELDKRSALLKAKTL